jgi:hypothetical protein
MATPYKDSAVPEWKDRIAKIKNKDINTIVQHERQFKFNKNEVGIRNTKTDSHIKVFDNGNIEMFAGDTSGITVSDAYDTVNLYGNAVNLNTHNINMYTRPYGLSWNGYLLNPELYQLYDDDFQLNGSVRYWVEATDKVPAHWERRSVSMRPFIRYTESDEFAALLTELGITI